MTIQEQIKLLNGYTFMGWENGWERWEPFEVVTCRKKGHVPVSLHDHQKCDHLYWCEECKIYWQKDSSD